MIRKTLLQRSIVVVPYHPHRLYSSVTTASASSFAPLASSPPSSTTSSSSTGSTIAKRTFASINFGRSWNPIASASSSSRTFSFPSRSLVRRRLFDRIDRSFASTTPSSSVVDDERVTATNKDDLIELPNPNRSPFCDLVDEVSKENASANRNAVRSIGSALMQRLEVSNPSGLISKVTSVHGSNNAIYPLAAVYYALAYYLSFSGHPNDSFACLQNALKAEESGALSPQLMLLQKRAFKRFIISYPINMNAIKDETMWFVLNTMEKKSISVPNAISYFLQKLYKDLLIHDLSVVPFQAQKIINVFKRIKEPSVAEIHGVLHACARTGNEKEMLSLFDKLSERGIDWKQDHRALSAMTTLYMQNSDEEKALKLIEEASMRNIWMYLPVVRYYAAKGRHEDLEKLFASMKVNYVQPDITCYQELAGAYARSNMYGAVVKAIASAEQFAAENKIDFTSMRAKKFYTSILSNFAKGHHADSAAALLELMITKGLKPDLFVYTAVITAYVRVRDQKKATEFFYKLIEEGYKPDSSLFSLIISMYAKAGDVQFCFSLINRMKKLDLPISAIAYGPIIDFYCKMKWISKAFDLIKEMKKEGVQLTTVIFATILHALAIETTPRQRFNTEIEKLLQIMEKENVLTNPHVFTALVAASINANSEADTKKYYEQAKNENKVDLACVTLLLSHYLKQNNHQKAREIYEDMKRFKLRPDEKAKKYIFKIRNEGSTQ